MTSLLEFASDAEPGWMPQLRQLAARLGVPPTDEATRGRSFFLAGCGDELYDVGALLIAFLDQVAER